MTAVSNVPVSAKKKLEFAYDYAGRRIQKKVFNWNASTANYQIQSLTKFVYDDWNVIAELDGNNALVKGFVQTNQLLMVQQSGESYFAGYDANENVVSLTKAGTGKTVAQYDYDPFGNTLQENGEASAINPFRFSSKYTDAETNLVYYGYRYYNPQTGKWISKYPIEEDGGVNLYGFVSNSPINLVDELGMLPRSHWEKIALNSIDFDDKWEVDAVLKRNRRITASYGKMFKRKPDVYVWCGLASFASNLAGQSMNAAALELKHSLIATAVGLGGANQVSLRVLSILALGNYTIYKDMMWQHEAYDFGGIEEMRSKSSRELDPVLLSAWEDVDCGQKMRNRSLIFRGAATMADYEQKKVLQDIINRDANLMAQLSGLIQSPIPNDPITFRGFRSNASFANGDDRADYAVDHLVPTFRNRLETKYDETMRLINDLILKGQQ